MNRYDVYLVKVKEALKEKGYSLDYTFNRGTGEMLFRCTNIKTYKSATYPYVLHPWKQDMPSVEEIVSWTEKELPNPDEPETKAVTVKENYVETLRQMIKDAGYDLIDHADKMVDKDLEMITDFNINISFSMDSIPEITWTTSKICKQTIDRFNHENKEKENG